MRSKVAKSRAVFRGLLFAALVLATTGANARGQQPAPAATSEQVEAAIVKAREWLYSQQANGNWEGTVKVAGGAAAPAPAPAGQVVGRTALVAYALLCARDENKIDPRLVPALNYVTSTDTDGVYALGLRGQVLYQLSQIKDFKEHRKDADVQTAMAVAMHDAQLLITGVGNQGLTSGMYTYQVTANQPRGGFDHSCSNYGTMGVWATAQTGLEVPLGYWQMVENGWKAHQNKDGGWSYVSAEGPNQASTASMTAGALVNLFICQEYLSPTRTGDCKGNPNNPNIEAGIKWLGEHYANVNASRSYYTMFNIQRVGAESGYQVFKDVDWFKSGAEMLVRTQQPTGQWGGDAVDTAFALAFLSLGRAPVAINKLQYGIDPNVPPDKQMHWNQRPRDAANLTHWLSKNIHRYLNWQIVNLQMPPEVLQQAPILYIAGDQELKFDDKEMEALRTYVLQGGLILGNADCASKKFAKSFTDLGEKLFPIYQFRPLPADHPIFQKELFPFKGKKGMELAAIGNDVREFMILMPDNDPSRSWHLLPQLLAQKPTLGEKEGLFNVAANIYYYATEKASLYFKGKTHIVQEGGKPDKKLTLGRLRYDGNWNPEPGGWEQIRKLMNRNLQTDLHIDELKLGTDALNSDHPVVYLTGTRKIEFTDDQREQLRRFCYEGGLLIVDAAGGSEDFARSIEIELKKIFQQDPELLKPDHPVYSAAYKITEVAYRQLAREALKDPKAPRIYGIEQEGKMKVLYSPLDLSCGYVGQPIDGINGYVPTFAQELILNMLVFSTTQK